MRTLGLQMINEGLMLTRAGYRILLGDVGSGAAGGDGMLLESADYILLETGDYLLLE